MSGDLTGAGELVKDGAGTLTLTGTNTYNGGTSVLDGGLTGTAASLQGDIDNEGIVTFDQTTDGTYSGAMTGHGNFEKEGSANLIITGNSGAWSGSTHVNDGRLSVNGTLGSLVSVGSGGTLGGSGMIGAAVVDGTFAPGNSIDQINVTGDLSFGTGSTLEIEYSTTDADRIDVGGNLNIAAGSTLELKGLSGTYGATTGPYTILTATGTITGTFNPVHNDLAFLDADVDYNAHDILLSLVRNDTDFSEVAEDKEQAGVANAVEDLGAGNDIYDAFTGLTASEARDALDSLSGEHNAGVAGAMAESAGVIQSALSTHMNGLNHGNNTGDTAALAAPSDTYVAAYMEPAAGGSGWDTPQMWFEMIGTIGHSSQDNSAPAQDRHSYGALAGVDIPMEAGGYYGFFAGYETGEIETDTERASSELGNYHLGVYATQPYTNGWIISGGVGATYHDIDSQRYVVFPGFEGAPSGETQGQTLSGFIEAAHTMDLQGMAIEPFANVSLTYSHMDGYDEENGNGAELSVDSVTNTVPATVLGVRTGKQVRISDSTVNLTGSLGWQHSYGDTDNESQMRFASGTSTFDAFGPSRTRDSALVGLGVNAGMSPGMKAYAGYNGSLAPDNQDHGFKAGVKMDF
jgi:outer membrane autotransporter protein